MLTSSGAKEKDAERNRATPERSLTLAGRATTTFLLDGRFLARTCLPSRLCGRLKLAGQPDGRHARFGHSRRSPLFLRAAADRHFAVVRDAAQWNVGFPERRSSLDNSVRSEDSPNRSLPTLKFSPLQPLYDLRSIIEGKIWPYARRMKKTVTAFLSRGRRRAETSNSSRRLSAVTYGRSRTSAAAL